MGGRQGAVVAEILARKGVSVHFATQLGQASPDLASSRDWGKVHGMLKKLGVKFHVDCELSEICEDHVRLQDLYTKQELVLNSISNVVLVQAVRQTIKFITL